MSLDFKNLEKPIRRRKRSVFSEKFLGRDAILQIRVTASEKQELQWLAKQRGEPLATMLAKDASALARISINLQKTLTNRKIQLGNFFAILRTITIGDVELFEWRPRFSQKNVTSTYQVADAYISRYASVLNELIRIYGGSLPFNLDEYMARHQPELGCSIEQAIREFQNKKVDRFVRKLEKERKIALSAKV